MTGYATRDLNPARCSAACRDRTHSLVRTSLACAISALFSASIWAQQPPASNTNTEQVLPQVEVVELAPEPGTSNIVNGDALERSNSMKDVVRNQPLVSAPGTAAGTSRNRSSFDRSGTTGYNIRGIEGNRIGMDVDGIEMPDATTRPYVSRAGNGTFGVGRDFIDPEMFSSVSILSGTTSAARSAGGIGGAVSFKTKSASDYLRGDKTTYFGGKVGYDSADRSRNESITAAGKRGDLDGLIAYSRRDGHASKNNSEVVDSAPEDWHSDALLLKGGLRIDGANRLELSADLYRRQNDTSFSGWDSTDSFITNNSRQVSDTSRNTLQLMHLWTPSNAWIDHADTRLFFQNTGTEDITDTTTLSSGATAHNISENKTRTWGLSSTAGKRLDRHQLSFGLNASTQEVERPWNVSGYMKPQPDTTTNRLGAFLQDDISFDMGGKRLTVTPALRADYVKIKTHDLENFVSGVLTEADVERIYGGNPSSTILSPSLALAYELTPRFIAYAQYKRGGRAPSAGEIFGSWNMASNYAAGNQYALVGNRDLQEETSDAVEFGLKGSPTPGVTLNTSLFYTRYQDFIAYTRYTRALYPGMFTNVPSHIGTIYQANNRDEAKVYGFELSARLDHGQWNKEVRGLYSTWAVGISRGTSKSKYDGDADVPLDSVLPRKAIIGVGYDAPMKAWGINVTGTFVGSKQAVATNRNSYSNSGATLTDSETELFRVPGYAVFDLIGYWQLNKNMRLDVGLYNLSDKRYWNYSNTHSLQPEVPRDQRDIELLTEAGRTVAVSLNMAF